ncbi:MBL fold metallo-hydrolase [Sphingomonas sp. AR_OL41]|uniref:MBL fold metallo-hydrolase n=1 Tax=Sphingomonas sp. AR_OL41 TaxID=3042729 RepID=UPI002480C3F0|nr:MBL fold metallo-hydrolase [Sphingomonas sp. AR_OL41]MDH7972714.1 MBL fold metallo-hydrolase [Sphingomonas sp. AR_OL41]
MNRYYQGPPSDHFDGTRFFNPGHATTDRGLGQVLRWKLREKAAAWPRSVAVTPSVPEPRIAGLSVTAVGHATLLIQLAGRNILTDPLWSERASPTQLVGPKRVTAPGIAFDRLPPIDTVLLSHNHYDHLDIATLRRLVAVHRPLIVTPLGNDAIVRRAVPAARITAGDWGERVELGGGAEVHIVPAQHWSARGIGDRRMALWGGFMLRSGGTQVYFAGDTGYGDGAIFRAMHRRYGAPELALIPIGAYAPRWFMAAQHVDPDEAVRIMLDIEAKRAIGIHWGTFQLTDEARDAPLIALQESLARRGIDPARFPAAIPGKCY